MRIRKCQINIGGFKYYNLFCLDVMSQSKSNGSDTDKEQILEEVKDALSHKEFEVENNSDRFFSLNGNGWMLSVGVGQWDMATVGLLGDNVENTIERDIATSNVARQVVHGLDGD